MQGNKLLIGSIFPGKQEKKIMFSDEDIRILIAGSEVKPYKWSKKVT